MNIVRLPDVQGSAVGDFLQEYRKLEARAADPQPLHYRREPRTRSQRARGWALRAGLAAGILSCSAGLVGGFGCLAFFDACSAWLAR
jgi:hypothetical protein